MEHAAHDPAPATAAPAAPVVDRPLAEPVALLDSVTPDVVRSMQRTAGNRSTTAFLARQAPAAAPAPPAAPTSPWWVGGPMVARKTKDTPLATYVAWVKDVEKAYASREEVVKRLRRLYYSAAVAAGPGRVGASNVAGPFFDKMIAGANDAAPLANPPLAQPTLDGLFETDSIVTPGGDKIDPTHILTMLDVSISGGTVKGGAVATTSGVPLKGIVTWTGDLASWFVDWVAQKKKAPAGTDEIALLVSRVNAKVGIDDLVSDMDAQAMAAARVDTKKGTFSDTRTLNQPLSQILDDYYGRGAPVAGSPPPKDDRQRFHLFVKSAAPPIPHTIPDATKPDEVALDAKAEDAIFKVLFATAEQLMEGSNTITRIGTPDALDENQHIVREIAKRFHKFLETGLQTGSAPWP